MEDVHKSLFQRKNSCVNTDTQNKNEKKSVQQECNDQPLLSDYEEKIPQNLEVEDDKTLHSFELKNLKDLPQWIVDNTYIHTGYRVHFSIRLCFQSLFHHHNETLCIWTHLLGFLLFVVLTFLTWTGLVLTNPDPMDEFIFSVFLLCAQAQMLFSTIFHTFNCHGPKTYKWLAKLDYTGITVMIVGSYFPPLYYGFRCEFTLRAVYLTLISLLGVIGVIVSMFPIFATPKYRTVRAVFFLVFGWFAVVPVPHMAFLYGFEVVWPFVWRELLMGITYVIGAVIYSTRIPEKFWPGKFDSCGSHVIWHLFSIAAALEQFFACVYFYHQKDSIPCFLNK